MSKKVLGRGIEALIFQEEESVHKASKEGIAGIDISLIETNPDQPRKIFNEETLRELADSIKEQGVIQPIIVEEKNGKYIIVAGERRFRAARIAGKEKIPAIVRKVTEEEKLEIALIENIQRENLSPIEEARAYHDLMKTTGIKQEVVAKKVGKKRSTIANSLRLLRLPVEIQKSISCGEISAGHARAILSVLNPADLQILYKRILEKGLSVRETERSAAEFNKGKRLGTGVENKVSTGKQDDIKIIEQKFIEKMGTKVSIKGDFNGGKIIIHYFSREDMDRIYEIMNG